jgi:hypothetical protein
MATKADQSKAQAEQDNSARKRVTVGVKRVTAGMRQKRATGASPKGRAVHARTKSRADAKAGKPGDGKKVARWKTGPNGGEDQTTNGVRAGTRGADGPPGRRPSRKSTRGEWAAGEKRDAQLTRRQRRRLTSPKARAARRK